MDLRRAPDEETFRSWRWPRSAGGSAMRRSLFIPMLVGISLIVASPGPANGSDYAAKLIHGKGFDASQALSTSALDTWWTNSQKWGFGWYLGGVNACCPQPNLSNSWLNHNWNTGWYMAPIWVGRQLPLTCFNDGGSYARISDTLSTAYQQGSDAADSAFSTAAAYSAWPTGAIIYLDFEGMTSTSNSCVNVLHAYVNGWDDESNFDLGHTGIYASSSMGDYIASAAAPPANLWCADHDMNENVTCSFMTNSNFPNDHRSKQWQGTHSETHGGVPLTIDNDCFDSVLDSNLSTDANVNNC
jgi:hypothetical protein